MIRRKWSVSTSASEAGVAVPVAQRLELCSSVASFAFEAHSSVPVSLSGGFRRVFASPLLQVAGEMCFSGGLLISAALYLCRRFERATFLVSPSADLAVVQATVRHARVLIKLGELLLAPATPAYFRPQLKEGP